MLIAVTNGVQYAIDMDAAFVNRLHANVSRVNNYIVPAEAIDTPAKIFASRALFQEKIITFGGIEWVMVYTTSSAS
jgi:hypothetical protein